MKRFEFMQQHAHTFQVARMSSILNVSRSGYYVWKRNHDKLSPRQANRISRDIRVKAIFEASKRRYGALRIQQDLKDEGCIVNIKTIRNSMKRQELVAKAAKKFKVTTTSDHNLPVSPNLLHRNFTAVRPNEKWVGDITYLWTSEGWLYLAVVIDLYSRSVVGWSMSERMTASLVCDALSMALFRRSFPKNVIFHSDRGSQYCSTMFQSLLSKNNLLGSMSRKGNCWDNACSESFFHTLKVEALDNVVLTRDQMRALVFEYIEVDYNRERRHSALGYLSPEKFEIMQAA